jgi:outer membrane immunogenic protein
MRRFLLGSAVSTLLAAPVLAGGFAAEIIEPPPPPPPPMAAAPDWSGSHVGVTLGYGSGSYEQGTSDGDIGPEVDVDGGMYGLAFGYDWQRGNRVFGLELAASSGIDGITEQGTVTDGYSCITGDCNIDIETLYTLRGRYGALINPSTLLYASGGVAAANVEGGIFDSDQQGSSTATGFIVGIGAERLLSSRLSVSGEINYVDLGTLEFGIADGTGGDYEADGDFATVRIGLNYRF